MSTATQQRLSALAGTWRQDAERRKKMFAADPGAEILRYCADELEAELRDVAEADEELSVAAYASLHGKSVSTVRRWCQHGLITARQVGREYVIRRGEPAPRFGAIAS